MIAKSNGGTSTCEVGHTAIILLVLVFVNDVPKYISNANITMYADDTTIILSSDSYENLELQIPEVFDNF